MSVKFKLSLAFFLMFLVATMLMLGSFLLFYRSDYRYDIERERQKYENQLSSLVKKASEIGGGEDEIISILSETAGDRLKIELYDLNGQLLWSGGDVAVGIKLSAKDYILKGDRIAYAVKLSGSFRAKEEILEKYIGQYFWLIIILIFGLFALIAFFLNYSISKPISELHNRMDENPFKIKNFKKKYRDDEIGMLEKRYDEMVQKLQITDRQQQTMLAAISHDLRTPLTSILTYTERLLSGKNFDDEKRNRYLGVVAQKAEDMKILLEKFQEVAKEVDFVDDGNYELVSAASLFVSIFKPYFDEWDNVDAKLEFECEISEKIYIRADNEALKRVVSNILSNAIKYGAYPLLVKAKIFLRGNEVVLKIENNGRQVDPDKLSLLFDRFYRAETSRSAQNGGIGLGLYICRQIIEAHGGKIFAYKPWDNDFGIEIALPIY